MGANSFQVAIVETMQHSDSDSQRVDFSFSIRDHGWVELVFATYAAFREKKWEGRFLTR